MQTVIRMAAGTVAAGLLAAGCSSGSHGPSQAQVTAERMAHATAIAMTMASYQPATVWGQHAKVWRLNSGITDPVPGTYVLCLPIAAPRKYTCTVTNVGSPGAMTQTNYTVTVQSDADMQSPFTAAIISPGS